MYKIWVSSIRKTLKYCIVMDFHFLFDTTVVCVLTVWMYGVTQVDFRIAVIMLIPRDARWSSNCILKNKQWC